MPENVVVLVVNDPNSDDPFQISGVYGDTDLAIVAVMEYLDEYNPRQSTDDASLILTDDPDITARLVVRPYNGRPDNGF